MDLNLIESRINQIKKTNLASLSNAVWVSDESNIRLMLEGILRIQDMQYLEVLENSETIVSVGEPQEDNIVSRSFVLSYPYNERILEIGELKVIVSLDGVYNRLINKVLVILGTQAVKTFIVSFFILFIFYFLVGRHFFFLANQARNATHGIGPHLFFLNRPQEESVQGDELDQLVESFNTMATKMLQNEKRYRTIIETTSEGFTRFDAETQKVVEVNQALCEILGYSREELLSGFPNEFTDLKNRQVLKKNKDYLDQASHNVFEVTLISKAGKQVVLRVSASNLLDPSGGLLNIYAFYTDITNAKLAAEELEQHRDHLQELVKDQTHELIHAKEAAETANQAKSKFISSMSHELRTPLNSIMGFAQLLQIDKEISGDERRNASINYILSGGEHLLTLINDILDLAKIESGSIAISMENVTPGDVVRDCLELMAPLSEKAEITIIDEVLSGTHLPMIQADPTRLKQALVNLVSNGIKYNKPNGSVKIRCEVQPTKHVLFSVEDTGYGIPKDKMKDLFRPFARLGAESSNIEGTGIGLSLTQNLVDVMGGELKVESVVNQGSVFSFELPISSSGLE
ncbi:MAG: ATP-binding protein [Rhodospirillales bacterium]|nr:ATP-binding protein [Rhodospirillales bacterium]